MSSKGIGLSQTFLSVEIIMCWLLILRNIKSYMGLGMHLRLWISKRACFAPVLLSDTQTEIFTVVRQLK